MKHFSLPLFLFLLLLSSCSTPASESDVLPEVGVLNTETDRMSYSMGVTYGRQFLHMGVKVDPEAFVKGYRERKAGQEEVTDGNIESQLGQLERALGARGGKPFSPDAPYQGEGERLSYIVGASLARQVEAQRYNFNTEPLMQGCIDGFDGTPDSELLLTTQVIENFMLVIPRKARKPDAPPIPKDTPRYTIEQE